MSTTNNIALRDNPVTIQTEEDIIRASQENPAAFQKLYERHYAQIFSFILKRVNDKATSADIAQQVFIKALSSIKKYINKGVPYSAYLYRIATNECNSFFREQNKIRFVVVDEIFTEGLMDQLDIEDTYDSNMAALKNAFKLLKVDEIQLLELRFFEMKSFKEVGYIMSITENSAKVKTYRLLGKMKKMMEI
jgi:RNA polymerase sigma-70 factor (ECF subfamily)